MVEALIKGILTIAKYLFTAIKGAVPWFGVPVNYATALVVILSTCTQANNFLYFIMGDTASVLVPSVITLLTYKYLAYPIINYIIGIMTHKASN